MGVGGGAGSGIQGRTLQRQFLKDGALPDADGYENASIGQKNKKNHPTKHPASTTGVKTSVRPP